MSTLIRITGADNQTRTMEVEAGATVPVAPGDTVELPGVNPADVTVDDRGGNVELGIGNEAPIVFQGFSAHLEANAGVSMLIGEGPVRRSSTRSKICRLRHSAISKPPRRVRSATTARAAMARSTSANWIRATGLRRPIPTVPATRGSRRFRTSRTSRSPN